MKGIVFTQFADLVEERFGLELLDRIIQRAELPSDGAYTSVASYDHLELLRLVARLHEETAVPVSTLVRTFGEHLFRRLALSFPELLAAYQSVCEFLEHLEGTIHQEVLKLYPDAELPQIHFERLGATQVAMVYRSTRPFADLAEGLIRGCARHYGETFELTREDLDGSPGTAARFVYRVCASPEPSAVVTPVSSTLLREGAETCPTPT